MKALRHVSLAVVAMFLAVSSFAGSWDWMRPYKDPDKTVNTLIIIGNRRKPRIMADIIQAETKQPILVIPADSDGKIFFMPAKDTTMDVEFDDLRNFVKYLKPRRIVVLGDERYVPKQYLDQIDPSQTVVVVKNKSWRKIASMTQEVMDLTYLKREYAKAEDKLESGELYRPTGAPAPSAEPAPVEIDKSEIVETTETEVVVDEGALKDAENAQKDAEKAAEKDVSKNSGTEKTLPEPKLIDDTKVVPK